MAGRFAYEARVYRSDDGGDTWTLWGGLATGNNEALLLMVFGLTLLVGGLAQQLQISAAEPEASSISAP
mgnify:CR=1 FL=1